jgi:mRNA interferase RelE/StbE
VESYELFIKPSAAKELEAVGRKSDRTRIVDKIYTLKDDPRPQGCEKLTGQDRYRVRQGQSRILYVVDDKERVVTVVKIGHRRDVYR